MYKRSHPAGCNVEDLIDYAYCPDYVIFPGRMTSVYILHSVAEGNMISKLEVEGPSTGSLFQSNKGYDINIARIEG